MPDDVCAPRHAGPAAPGQANAPVLAQPGRQRGVPDPGGRTERQEGVVVEFGVGTHCRDVSVHGCGNPGIWPKTCRRIQACIAIAAAEAAFMDRVEPNCSIDSVSTAAA
jgi:hypothetical protein